MSERGTQIAKALHILSTHAEVVAAALGGTISAGDRSRNNAIEALFSIGALKPVDEDSYRLHPLLRDFFATYFASYNAFEALLRISDITVQASAQWREYGRLRREGGVRDQDRLLGAFEESIADIAHSIEHNLAMLHCLLATQYGNVNNVQTKFRQNTYYHNQVNRFLLDVQGIDAFVQRCADEALSWGAADVRRFLLRRISSRLLGWTAQIRDAQAVISKRLHEAKLMDARLKRLSRLVLFMSQHPACDGWDLAVDVDAPIQLLRPDRQRIRPQPDVRDVDELTSSALTRIVERLPRSRQSSMVVQTPAPQMLIDDGDTLAPLPVADPIATEIERIAAKVHDTTVSSERGISLLQWKREHGLPVDMDDETWLIYACMQLRGKGLSADFKTDQPPTSWEINVSFSDVVVSAALRP